jgi:hypothetical protein
VSDGREPLGTVRQAAGGGQVFALELKAEGGRPTEIQLATIAAMEAAGAYCCIAEGLDRAIAVLEGWGLLCGRSQ